TEPAPADIGQDQPARRGRGEVLTHFRPTWGCSVQSVGIPPTRSQSSIRSSCPRLVRAFGTALSGGCASIHVIVTNPALTRCGLSGHSQKNMLAGANFNLPVP